jgi:hypothetical protein
MQITLEHHNTVLLLRDHEGQRWLPVAKMPEGKDARWEPLLEVSDRVLDVAQHLLDTGELTPHVVLEVNV